MMLFAMCLIYLHNFGVCEPTEDHRIQRRFMWKQMDNTMGGLMGGMASSARVMKNMIGDLMPTTQTTSLPHMHSNILDYLPSETTRVKYIIRNPTNRRPMKVIKIRSPKKVIKIMTVPKAIVESKVPRKQKIQFPSINELRKLEKEQEMIAEGHILPSTSESERESDTAKESDSEDASDADSNDDFEDAKDNNEIISGQIYGFGEGWAPVVEVAKKPAHFSTAKPYAVSKLHTRVVSSSSEFEEPSYDISEADTVEHVKVVNNIPIHSYEVNEYTAEESVALPLTQEYRSNTRGFVPYRGAQHQTLPSTTPSASTTTSEEPNYPISFLRKHRERAAAAAAATLSHASAARFKASESAVANSWIPTSNTSTQYNSPRERQPQQQQLHISSSAREKWPPEVPPPRPFGMMASTANPVKFSEQTTTEAIRSMRKGARLKIKLTTNEDSAKPRDVQQRGSVKFGDKLLLDQY